MQVLYNKECEIVLIQFSTKSVASFLTPCMIKVSEHDQEIPQSQTADKPMAPRGRATQQSRDTRKTN